MSTEHTPEPWPDPDYDNSDTSASEWWDIPGIGRFWKEEDALRVQAAVNACAGYDTVALQGAGTGYFHRAMRDMIAEIKKKDAALERIANDCPCDNDGRGCPCEDVANAAFS